MLTLGADVEFILRNKSGNLRSVEGLIGGTKKDPVWFETGNLQEDNVLAEMAINPAKTKKEWISNLNKLKRTLSAKFKPVNLKIDISASAIYPEELLCTPQAKEFGCSPDYDAWELAINDPPECNTNLRSAGGHIHIGIPNYDPESVIQAFHLTRWLDIYLGVPSVLLDDDSQRRTLYGKAGSFRPKPYGLEYRTLSNFWVKNNRLMSWVWDQVHKAYEAYLEVGDFPECDEDLIKSTINDSNVESAFKIVQQWSIAYG